MTAQDSVPTNSYPASDAPLTLSSGTVVRMRTIAVCRTQACIETREQATENFHFVRTAGGDWEVDPNTWGMGGQ